ncbi:MAG: deoxyribonuclease IV [Armatimonadota bacterium]|nr:deoxyribonuclease IV [Armatimonadota bacterium]
MRLGVHVRIAAGLSKAIAVAERLGCETIQLFASNPNAWRESVVDQRTASDFRQGVSRVSIYPVILHTAYLLNLASADELIYSRSSKALALALPRADLLGAQHVVTHIGSHGGTGYAQGIRRINEAVRRALDASPGDHMVLLEGGAGAGNTIGSQFDEMAELLDGFGDYSERVGIALDTAHLWAAGYDLSNEDAVDRTLAEFDRTVGLSRLRLLHCNDTKMALGSHRDRHWHIGEGNIGIAGFRAIVNHESLRDVPGILETPMDEPGLDERNLSLLKSLREPPGPEE